MDDFVFYEKKEIPELEDMLAQVNLKFSPDKDQVVTNDDNRLAELLGVKLNMKKLNIRYNSLRIFDNSTYRQGLETVVQLCYDPLNITLLSAFKWLCQSWISRLRNALSAD